MGRGTKLSKITRDKTEWQRSWEKLMNILLEVLKRAQDADLNFFQYSQPKRRTAAKYRQEI